MSDKLSHYILILIQKGHSRFESITFGPLDITIPMWPKSRFYFPIRRTGTSIRRISKFVASKQVLGFSLLSQKCPALFSWIRLGSALCGLLWTSTCSIANFSIDWIESASVSMCKVTVQLIQKSVDFIFRYITVKEFSICQSWTIDFPIFLVISNIILIDLCKGLTLFMLFFFLS